MHNHIYIYNKSNHPSTPPTHTGTGGGRGHGPRAGRRAATVPRSALSGCALVNGGAAGRARDEYAIN